MATGIPYSPTGFPGDFDVEENQLARQQALYEALQAKGGVTGLGAALRGMLTGYDPGAEIQQRQQDLAKRRSAAAQDWLGRMPQDTPFKPGWNESVQAGDETGGPGFSNYTPGQEPTPAHTVTPQENLQWATQGFGLGSAPTKIAEAALLKATAGKSKDQYISTPYGIFNADKGKYEPPNQIQLDELKSKQDERVLHWKTVEEAAKQRSQDLRYSADQRAEAAAAMVAARREIAQLIHATTNQGSLSLAGTDAQGNPIMLHNKAGLVDRAGNPYAGPLLRPGEMKDVNSASQLLTEADYHDKLAKDVRDPKNADVFGNRANIGDVASNIVGGFGKEQMTGLTPEQLQLRGLVGRDLAATTKQLYGSAFTTSEQQRAGSFTVLKGDSPAMVAQKLEGAARFNREMVGKYGQKVVGAAAARMGGTPPATDGWGKAVAQ